jgi:microcystin-dependent protein
MATPPFDINIALPGDSDIVSQHPVNARAFRDIVESWLLVNHNNLGQHQIVEMPWIAAQTNGVASLTKFYVDTNGELHGVDTVNGDFLIGAKVGQVSWTAALTADPGHLVADGSAVSRTTFARLFNRIGTTHGAGDGSTTFNVPQVIGRAIIGVDPSGTNVAGFGTVGARGGVAVELMSRSQLPNVSPVFSGSPTAVSVTSTEASFAKNATSIGYDGGGATAIVGSSSGGVASTGTIIPLGVVDSLNGNVTQTGTSKIQPSIALLPQIKY